MFPSPQQTRGQSIAPSPTERYSSGYFAGESWNPSSREMSYQASTLPAMRSAPKFESSANDFRPTLPSLPSLTLERGVPRGQAAWPDYALDSSWSGAQSSLHRSGSTFSSPLPGSSSSQQTEYFRYEHPRGQSYSGPSMHDPQQTSDRSPFSSRDYYLERPDIGETGGMDATKHRKRRGNLPKETTDKLRAWFVAHLHHPYPTEDEKQELMRQTRLQMSMLISVSCVLIL
jgi:Homeobox KN domain